MDLIPPRKVSLRRTPGLAAGAACKDVEPRKPRMAAPVSQAIGSPAPPRSVESPSPHVRLPRRPQSLDLRQQPAANGDGAFMRGVEDPVQVARRPGALSAVVILLRHERS